MKQLSYILIAAGGIVTTFCAMCDAEGIYYNLLIAVIAVALFLILSGMCLYRIAEKRERRKRRMYFQAKRRDRLDRDMVMIDLDKKIAP